MWRDSGMPANAITSDTQKKNVALVPITRLAWAVSLVPIAWPTRMVAAMPTPNTAPIRKNMMLLAFAVAVSASSPRKRPTQIALTEPLSDCSTLPPRIGSANTNRVRPIGPWVRSRVPVFGIVASCQKPRDGRLRDAPRATGAQCDLDADRRTCSADRGRTLPAGPAAGLREYLRGAGRCRVAVPFMVRRSRTPACRDAIAARRTQVRRAPAARVHGGHGHVVVPVAQAGAVAALSLVARPREGRRRQETIRHRRRDALGSPWLPNRPGECTRDVAAVCP